MTHISISREEKLVQLDSAKLDIHRELYRTIAKLGLNPDTYDLDDFDFDANVALDQQDDDFLLRKHTDRLLKRLNLISAIIAEA